MAFWDKVKAGSRGVLDMFYSLSIAGTSGEIKTHVDDIKKQRDAVYNASPFKAAEDRQRAREDKEIADYEHRKKLAEARGLPFP